MTTVAFRLIELKIIDDEKASLEKAQNELESYIFMVKSVFEKDIYTACSTEKERTAAVDTARALGDWYEEQGQDTPKEVRLYGDIDWSLTRASLCGRTTPRGTSSCAGS